MKQGAEKIAILVLLSINCLTAFGWDDTGHKITAYIAWKRMTPDVREKVINILRSAPEDADISTFYLPYGSRSEEARKREFFMLMATWADIIRDKKFEGRHKKYHRGDWHYADRFWEYRDGKVNIVDIGQKSGMILEKLVEHERTIRNPAAPDAEKAIAVAWIEHLIGDLHQPLHAGSRVTRFDPKGDQGGNLFLLTPRGTPSQNQENLHWYWDSIIMRHMPNTADKCDAEYVEPIAESILKKYPYEKLANRLNPGKYDAWHQESFDIVSTKVYRDVKFFEMPSEKYRKRAFEIAEERLALAGYRMGDLFNDVFGPERPSAPTSPAQK